MVVFSFPVLGLVRRGVTGQAKLGRNTTTEEKGEKREGDLATTTNLLLSLLPKTKERRLKKRCIGERRRGGETEELGSDLKPFFVVSPPCTIETRNQNMARGDGRRGGIQVKANNFRTGGRCLIKYPYTYYTQEDQYEPR